MPVFDLDEEIEEEIIIEHNPVAPIELPFSSSNDYVIKSIQASGKILDRRMVRIPGVPDDAFKLNIDYSSIKTGLDLPRIFPSNVFKWNETKNRITVCVFNRTPRQRSLWATDVFSMFGSGKFHYKSLEATDCQFFGTCKSARESLHHPDCDIENSPTIGLVEWVKCCFHDRFTNAIRNQNWDIAVATGDEYCASQKAASGKDDFRFYFDGGNQSIDENKYLPLGPREEFRRVKPQHITLASKRMYLFNFVGSLTSRSRRILSGVLKKGVSPGSSSAFLHIIDTWSKEATRMNGYILPHEYRRVLLNSTFTLCPDGHNPEAYRIYEALEAGSIPIIALDQYYQDHACQHAFAPFLKSGAPFVYLNSWTGLRPFLSQVYNKPSLLIKMQADAMAWYAGWMKKKALYFEKMMTDRFEKRTGNH